MNVPVMQGKEVLIHYCVGFSNIWFTKETKNCQKSCIFPSKYISQNNTINLNNESSSTDYWMILLCVFWGFFRQRKFVNKLVIFLSVLVLCVSNATVGVRWLRTWLMAYILHIFAILIISSQTCSDPPRSHSSHFAETTSLLLFFSQTTHASRISKYLKIVKLYIRGN